MTIQTYYVIISVICSLWMILFSWLSCFNLWMFNISVMNLEFGDYTLEEKKLFATN